MRSWDGDRHTRNEGRGHKITSQSPTRSEGIRASYDSQGLQFRVTSNSPDGRVPVDMARKGLARGYCKPV